MEMIIIFMVYFVIWDDKILCRCATYVLYITTHKQTCMQMTLVSINN